MKYERNAAGWGVSGFRTCRALMYGKKKPDIVQNTGLWKAVKADMYDQVSFELMRPAKGFNPRTDTSGEGRTINVQPNFQRD